MEKLTNFVSQTFETNLNDSKISTGCLNLTSPVKKENCCMTEGNHSQSSESNQKRPKNWLISDISHASSSDNSSDSDNGNEVYYKNNCNLKIVSKNGYVSPMSCDDKESVPKNESEKKLCNENILKTIVNEENNGELKIKFVLSLSVSL